jgi:hypothetical protein
MRGPMVTMPRPPPELVEYGRPPSIFSFMLIQHCLPSDPATRSHFIRAFLHLMDAPRQKIAFVSRRCTQNRSEVVVLKLTLIHCLPRDLWRGWEKWIRWPRSFESSRSLTTVTSTMLIIATNMAEKLLYQPQRPV